MDGVAEFGAVANTVGEEAGELFHFAYCVGHFGRDTEPGHRFGVIGLVAGLHSTLHGEIAFLSHLILIEPDCLTPYCMVMGRSA